jgi:glycosyltransferase involved in cell wall biosynthesis
MVKILQVYENYAHFSDQHSAVGGYISHAIGVMDAFVHLGHQVTLYSYNPFPGWNNSSVKKHFLEASKFPNVKIQNLIRKWEFANQVLNAIRKEMPDLLYVRWENNPFFERVRKIFPRLPIVVECNSLVEFFLGIKEPSRLQRCIARRVDAGYARAATLISAVTQETKDFLLHRYPFLDADRILVNPNGVDTRRFFYKGKEERKRYIIPDDALVIGWAGNYRPWHRVDLLIRALQDIDRDNVFLMIMGSGSVETERNLRIQAGTTRSSQITFTGPIPYDFMPAHLSACDILAVPLSPKIGDHLYGSPIKLFEYMAVERAIIASKIGQVEQIIDDGRNGLLFEHDSVEDLVQALNRLLGDQELRSRLGKGARLDVENYYSWEANVTRFLGALGFGNCLT